VNVQLKIVSAWIKWADGDHDAALQAMRTAAAMEDATEKSPVSPGSIAPAPEMLGDMLLLAKQPKLALTAYESALKSTPGRLRAEYGAAVSAQEAGQRAATERHYRRLLTNCSQADSDLPELTQANYFLGKDKLGFDSVPTKCDLQYLLPCRKNGLRAGTVDCRPFYLAAIRRKCRV